MTERHPQYELFEKAHQLLKNANKIVIVAHQRPDGDTIGSALALSEYLKHLEKDHEIFCLHQSPEQLSFLKGAHEFKTDPDIIVSGDHDLVVCLDSGDLAYAGIEKHLKQKNNPHTVINIDHHATNTHYGHVNIVDAKASSTSELIYHLLSHVDFPISKSMATSMLTGIITDTGGFSNLATTSTALDVASKLLSRGARIWDIQANTSKNKSVTALKLWGIALSRLTRHPSGIVVTVLTKEDVTKYNADSESLEGIANFLNSVEGARAIMVIREEDEGKIKVSLRTTQPDVDVSAIAKLCGGGGHKKAAGFTINGRIIKTESGWQIE